MHSDVRPAEGPGRARRMRREALANAASRRKPPGPEATGRNRRKHCGLLVGTLGLVLMALGALLFTGTGGMMQYVLPAPGATQEGGELEALYEAGRKQMDTISDSLTGYAIGARKQGANVSVDGGQSVAVTLYAVGEGYFDVIHETLTNGRTISVTDVRSAANAIVLDESTALKLFSGDDPIGGEVKLDGLTFEVAGVIRSGRRIGEVDEHVAYVPITSVSRQAMQMQTVEVTARSTQSVASSILMEDTLAGWQKGGSFYSMDKLALGAVMPLRWMVLIVGCLVLLGLLARLNAQAWGRICFYADQLKIGQMSTDGTLDLSLGDGSVAVTLVGAYEDTSALAYQLDTDGGAILLDGKTVAGGSTGTTHASQKGENASPLLRASVGDGTLDLLLDNTGAAPIGF